MRFFQNSFQNDAKPILNRGILRENCEYSMYLGFLRRIRRIYALVQKSEQHEGRSFEKTSSYIRICGIFGINSHMRGGMLCILKWFVG